ncbi:MAG: hypothetical protein BBJ57_08760 [Desulfobacterales bacterium PC51MH44]|nr:MAG: hypothetical protein BBJ57_08760 [Desulfobacterales bacterium PC51MH44]
MEWWSIGIMESWVIKAEYVIFLHIRLIYIFCRSPIFLSAHHSTIPSCHYSKWGEAPMFLF